MDYAYYAWATSYSALHYSVKYDIQIPSGAGSGIRTHELLGDKALNLTPLTRLGDSRTVIFAS